MNEVLIAPCADEMLYLILVDKKTFKTTNSETGAVNIETNDPTRMTVVGRITIADSETHPKSVEISRSYNSAQTDPSHEPHKVLEEADCNIGLKMVCTTISYLSYSICVF